MEFGLFGWPLRLAREFSFDLSQRVIAWCNYTTMMCWHFQTNPYLIFMLKEFPSKKTQIRISLVLVIYVLSLARYILICFRGKKTTHHLGPWMTAFSKILVLIHEVIKCPSTPKRYKCRAQRCREPKACFPRAVAVDWRKRFISSFILTWEVKASASSGQDATQRLCCITPLQGCYGWVVLIGLGVKETGMWVHKQDTVILHSWSRCSL